MPRLTLALNTLFTTAVLLLGGAGSSVAQQFGTTVTNLDSIAVDNPDDNVVSDTVIFRFQPRKLMFRAPFRGNEHNIELMQRSIVDFREALSAGDVKIRVKGYCSSFPTEQQNLAAAKNRSNQVKSYFITHDGLRESDFVTSNYARPLDGLTDVVTLAYFVTAKPVVEAPAEVDDQTPQPAQTQPAADPVVDSDDTAQEQPTSAVVAPVSDQLAAVPADIPTTLSLKSNAIGWAMLLANAAVEIDFAPHWSAAVGFYYSGVDYFSSRRKFRAAVIRPEMRYWFAPRTGLVRTGLWAEAHAGLAWYNIALPGHDRIQDRNGHTPTIGGGLGLGYRISLGATQRWFAEFALGAGFYHLSYDRFQNTGHPHSGLLLGRTTKNKILVDNAAVSFGYTFDLSGKKGGGK